MSVAAEIVLDAGFLGHPKLVRARQLGGSEAIVVFIGAICWSRLHLTDGHVPSQQALELASVPPAEGETIPLVPDPQRPIRALLTAGLLKQADGGYEIHDYAQYQLTRSDVEQAQARKELRLARDRERKRRAKFRAESDRNPHGTATQLHARGTADSAVQTLVHSPSAVEGPTRSAVGLLKTEYPRSDDWRSSDYGHLDAWRRIALKLRDADSRTAVVLATIGRDVPESVIQNALELLEFRRLDRRRPLQSDTRYFVDTFRRLAEEHRKGAAA